MNLAQCLYRPYGKLDTLLSIYCEFLLSYMYEPIKIRLIQPCLKYFSTLLQPCYNLVITLFSTLYQPCHEVVVWLLQGYEKCTINSLYGMVKVWWTVTLGVAHTVCWESFMKENFCEFRKFGTIANVFLLLLFCL